MEQYNKEQYKHTQFSANNQKYNNNNDTSHLSNISTNQVRADYNHPQYNNPQYNTHNSHNHADSHSNTIVDTNTNYAPPTVETQQQESLHLSSMNNANKTISKNNNTHTNYETPHTQHNSYTKNTNYQYATSDGNTPYIAPTDTPITNYSDNYNEYSDTSNISSNNNTSNNKTEQFLLFSLIIAISITAIVIGVGWTLFYPKPISEQIATTDTENSLSEVQKANNTDNKDLVIIYRADEQETNDTAIATTNSIQTTVSKTTTQNSKKPVTTKHIATQSTSTATVASTPKVKIKTEQTKTNTKKATVGTTSTTPSKVHIDTKYWIQVFSTNNRDKANKIQNDLDIQGIKAVIVTKNINNNLFYRLRIGPYYNKDEGSKFLEWIRRNNRYKDAYISVEKG